MQFSNWSISLLVAGAVLSIIGGAGYFAWPVILEGQVKGELVLANNSKSYNLWRETPIPMYLELYMFNWTNPSETLSGKAKADFVEMGPYIFREVVTKERLVWNENGTITFNNRRTWHFVPEMSKGSLVDKVTNINVIAMTVGNILRQIVPQTLLPFVDPILQKEESHIYVTKTVQELVFDGCSDPFLNIFKKLKSIIKIRMPFDKFGWFYGRNNSVVFDGVFNMDTGASTLKNLGNLLTWNQKSHTNTFNGECGIVRGSGGELWPINSASEHEVFIFSSDICSSLQMTYKGSKDVEGIAGRIYVGDESTFDNGQLSSKNRCFCSMNQCPPQGARNIAKCRYGAPAFISHPHFYLADEVYRSRITGMAPSPELHELSITLDKVVSIPLEVNARLQISIFAEKIIGLSFFNGLPNAHFPMLWFNQRAAITGPLAGEMRTLTYMASYVEPCLGALLCLGLILLVLGSCMAYKKKKPVPSSPLLSESSDS